VGVVVEGAMRAGVSGAGPHPRVNLSTPRPGLPWWLAESLRIAVFMTPFVLAYYAWKHFV